ncbi:chromosome segregation protein SMC [Actinocatenispora rupis]|uniref:Chromosome partition protein Smc n=1 Tax=Actinocatenispora rupis TaxID=519421 RepID=A0A8J3JEB1_9ACTN|nr:chromosome segregation protein SMC [Actinocatenispora rupis]GID14353.1 chromosome partition protein Smc [Actinocatenispora rupis]
MHLKSLTLKGFKSFATATTLKLEPGITCVVGPNGSGKSNVVDAIAWVLGEQGAKALRGGKMDDVIFAGTSGRAPLGRAEVTLTIDNTDGALPIEYTEVSITRRLFRSGDGEYEINGDRCRLLDIQELLSDSGIGREMHVIVGQGQLDAVLHAKPEDRRAFIEEAAGVLKHRKRKEKALRKLDAMQANLNRVQDLTGELRRQLKPLGKQAEIARRAAGIQADLRDARLRLLADDLATLRGSLQQEVADEESVRGSRERTERDSAEAERRLTELEAELAADAPVLARAQETWYRLSALEERFRSTGQLAAERLRFLSADREDERPGRDPDALEREAERVREQENELRFALEEEKARLAETVEYRQQVESDLQDAERELVAAVKAVADRREGLAKLTGQVNAVRSRSQAAQDEIARVSAALAEARARYETAAEELAEAQEQADGIESGDADLATRLQTARQDRQDAEARVKELTDAERTAERDVARWKAREEALAMGLRRKDGAGALLAAGDRVPGVLGSVAALLAVEPGCEAAVAAALGQYADAVAVHAVDHAVAAVELLKADDAGRATLLVGSTSDVPVGAGSLPGGARWAMDVVKSPAELRPALTAVLGRTVLVPDLAAARSLVADDPTLRAVTADGDVLGADLAAGGSASAPSFIEVQAAVDEAKERRAEAEQRVETLGAQLDGARAEVATRRDAAKAVEQALREAEQRHNAASRRLAELGAAARSAQGEADRLEASRQKAEHARDADLAGLADLEERLRLAEDTPVDEDPDSTRRDELAAAVGPSRQAEMEARLAVRTAEERVRALSGRADGLARQAAQERAARERAAARKARRERGAAVARAVSLAAQATLHRIGESLTAAAAERDAVAAARVGREAELREVRGRAKELAAELERLTDAMHRDEVARAEQRMRIEQLEGKAAEDFGIDLDTLLGEYGPDQPVPPSAAELAAAEADGKPEPAPKPFDRPVQEKRAARGERELALLGKVNPLALEEFAALEERFKFLSEQLEDLKATRRDLLTVVKEVDDRILEVFRTAYEDTAREFETVFSVLFPGGEGRLSLTDPDDLLTTGIEVEARPPNKKVKRLSLLSGGERSLTAVALLCAIFRARPSPFYVMDEVEAALDDVNLGRLLDVMKLLQNESQLIVITHQKRTMEIADALYGVTMRGGVTQVISQRLNDAEIA